MKGYSNQLLCLAPVVLVMSSALALADFSGSYGAMPPSPGIYSELAPGSMMFGNWLLTSSAGQLTLDSSQAPGSLTFDTWIYSRPVGGYFLTTAAAAGVVTFSYTINGQGNGSFGWFIGNNPTSRLGQDTNLVSTAQTVSFPVNAGDSFGFAVYATCNCIGSTNSARRIVTIQNFLVAPPVQEPMVTARLTGTNIVISWPYPSTGFSLESAPTLDTSNWPAVTVSLVSNGPVLQVTLPLKGSSQFFRLRSP